MPLSPEFTLLDLLAHFYFRQATSLDFWIASHLKLNDLEPASVTFTSSIIVSLDARALSHTAVAVPRCCSS